MAHIPVDPGGIRPVGFHRHDVEPEMLDEMAGNRRPRPVELAAAMGRLAQKHQIGIAEAGEGFPQRQFDEFGRNAYGEPKTGAALEEGKALMKRGTVDLSMLDAKIEELCAKILLTFPDCTTKTIEELRKPKLDAWNRNKENARAWLALNMVTEARSGFTAFNEGTKDDREVDFVLLRQKLAAGQSWVGSLHDEIQPKAKKHG